MPLRRSVEPLSLRNATQLVWNLRLHGNPAGPTSITGTARIVPTIFYIIITSLQDTHGCPKLGRGR